MTILYHMPISTAGAIITTATFINTSSQWMPTVTNCKQICLWDKPVHLFDFLLLLLLLFCCFLAYLLRTMLMPGNGRRDRTCAIAMSVVEFCWYDHKALRFLLLISLLQHFYTRHRKDTALHQYRR